MTPWLVSLVLLWGVGILWMRTVDLKMERDWHIKAADQDQALLLEATKKIQLLQEELEQLKKELEK